MTTGPGTALVTGASGFIGRALVARLASLGYRIEALSRNPAAAFAEDVRLRIGDLATGAGLSPDLLDGVSVVFNCAGELNRPAEMRHVHVGGTRRLLACAARAGRPLHWVQLSSVGAYGPPAKPSQDRRVTEGSFENPVGEYETTKTESDRLVTQAGREGSITYTILRPSNVVGARMPNASVRSLISIVARRLFFYIGRPGAMTNYVHVDDVAAALVECARRPPALRQVFNLSSDCPLEDLVAYIARSLGVARPRLRAPEAAVRAAVAVIGQRLGNPLTPTRINALVNRTTYPSTKIESTLGFRFSRPMPAGIGDLLAAGA